MAIENATIWQSAAIPLLMIGIDCSASAQCGRYSVDTVQPACAGWVVEPRTLNDVGDMAGSFFCGGYDRACTMWNRQAGMTALQMPQGTYFSIARGINAAGQIAGEMEILGENGRKAFRHYDGQTIDLGSLSGGMSYFSAASAINSVGIVVGYSNTPTAQHAFMWDGVMKDLNLPLGPHGSAQDINDSNQICGWMGNALTTDRGFIWDNGTVTKLPIPRGAIRGRAFAINNLKDACGAFLIPNPNGPGQVDRAAFWPARGGVIEMGTLPGFYSIARDLNDQRVVVGESGYGFVWRDGVMMELNSLIPNNGLNIKDAVAINNNGQIAAEAYDTNTGETVAALLTPIPPQAGDTNCDWLVNIDDLAAVIAAWGTNPTPAPFAGSPDVNADGTVNIDDLVRVITHWSSP